MGAVREAEIQPPAQHVQVLECYIRYYKLGEEGEVLLEYFLLPAIYKTNKLLYF